MCVWPERDMIPIRLPASQLALADKLVGGAADKGSGLVDRNQAFLGRREGSISKDLTQTGKFSPMKSLKNWVTFVLPAGCALAHRRT